jgi:hypothetical protein
MFNTGKAGRHTVPLLLVLFALIGGLPIAVADVSDTILTITASTSRGEGTLSISADEGYWDGDDFHWAVDYPLEIRDGGDQLLGTFGPASVTFYADPQVSLGFAVQAGDDPTSFVITSALLSFTPIPAALARADAAFTLQDFWGTGALLTGDGPVGGAYLAQYNGFVPGGTTFGEGIQEIQVIPPAVLETADYASAPLGEYLPIGAASDMSSQIAFTLSPLALASGSANFEIIPEPATLLLICVGLLAARRR